jgi:hypothetical protein
MRKMQQEGMTTESTVPISYQEIINRAAGDPVFRTQIITSPQEVISEYSYSLEEGHKSSLNNYITSLQDKIVNRLDNMIKPKQSKTGI